MKSKNFYAYMFPSNITEKILGYYQFMISFRKSLYPSAKNYIYSYDVFPSA